MASLCCHLFMFCSLSFQAYFLLLSAFFSGHLLLSSNFLHDCVRQPRSLSLSLRLADRSESSSSSHILPPAHDIKFPSLSLSRKAPVSSPDSATTDRTPRADICGTLSPTSAWDCSCELPLAMIWSTLSTSTRTNGCWSKLGVF